LDAVKGLVCFHTLYYYDRSEIYGAISCCPDRTTLTAVIHRHKGDGGSLYDGEHLWERLRDSGEIRQWNASTNEAYTHRPTDKWFEYTSCVVSRGHTARVNDRGVEARVGATALAWTTNMLNADTHVLVIAECPHVAAMSDPNGQAPADFTSDPPEPSVDMDTCSKVASTKLWDVNGVKIPVPPNCLDMLEILYAIPRPAHTSGVRKTYDMRCALKCRNAPFVTKEGAQRLTAVQFEQLRDIAYWLNYANKHQQTRLLNEHHAGAVMQSRSGTLAVRAATVVTTAASAFARGGSYRNVLGSVLEATATEINHL